MPIPRFRIRTLMIAVAGLALFLAAVSWVAECVEMDLDLDEARIHAKGNGLIAGIEEWRSKTGRYPHSLNEADLTSPIRHHGGFHYEVNTAGFVLWFGVANGMSTRHEYRSYRDVHFSTSPGWRCWD